MSGERCKCRHDRTLFGHGAGSLVSETCEGCGARRVLRSGVWKRWRRKPLRGGPKPERPAWRNMKRRCSDERLKDYPLYGGRGITVCERWMRSFADFYADVGPRPSSKHSLDRWPNNNGNYEPGNVRWATPEEQNANTRVVRMLEFNGERLPIKAWARRLGVTAGAILNRLNAGFTPEEALTIRFRRRGR